MKFKYAVITSLVIHATVVGYVHTFESPSRDLEANPQTDDKVSGELRDAVELVRQTQPQAERSVGAKEGAPESEQPGESAGSTDAATEVESGGEVEPVAEESQTDKPTEPEPPEPEPKKVANKSSEPTESSETPEPPANPEQEKKDESSGEPTESGDPEDDESTSAQPVVTGDSEEAKTDSEMDEKPGEETSAGDDGTEQKVAKKGGAGSEGGTQAASGQGDGSGQGSGAEGGPAGSGDGPSGEGGAGGKSRQARKRAYTRAILTAVDRAKEYPRLARRAGHEGIVYLSVAIDDGGRIQKVEVQKSSGHRILDKAAIRDITDMEKLPAPPDVVSERTLTIPVRYNIT